MSSAAMKLSNQRNVTQDDDEPKGKKPSRSSTAFTFYMKERKEAMDQAGNKLKAAELKNLCTDEWKNMNDADKKKFLNLEVKDKRRYAEEMAAFDPPSTEKVKRKRPSTLKDPNAPKKPLTAYFIFIQQNRDAIKKQNPELKQTELTKLMGRTWNEMSDSAKEAFQKKSAALRKDYEEEVQKYKERKSNAENKEN